VIGVRLMKRSVLGGSVVVLLALAVSPVASAAAPWWHVTSGSYPSTLNAGLARDAVLEMTVSATSGDFFVGPETLNEAIEHHDLIEKLLPYNATREEVQKQLESAYPGSKIEVTGGPGGTSPYKITFPGQQAFVPPDQQTPVFKAQSFPALFGKRECKELEEFEFGAPGSCGGEPGKIFGPLEGGLSNEPEVTEKAQGRPDGQIVLTATNLGDLDADGSGTRVTITDRLPAGLKAVAIEGTSGEGEFNRGPVKCVLATLSCSFAGTLPPYRQIEVFIDVVVEKGAVSGAVNEATVSGGGASTVTAKRPVAVGGEPSFGGEDYELTHEEAGGTLDTQAGSHPFQQTTTIMLNQDLEVNFAQTPHGELRPRPVALAKDLHFKWPAGLVGNATPIPRCSLGQFLSSVHETNEEVSGCPPQTAIGVARLVVNEPPRTMHKITVPLFNIEPSVGEPVRTGFRVLSVPVLIDTGIRTGSDYGVTVSSYNITQSVGFVSGQFTVWGTPGNAAHDNARGYGCLAEAAGIPHELPCHPLEQHNPPPFLVMPPSCGGPLQTSVEMDSWAQPGVFRSFSSEPLPALDGCNRLPFTPSISVSPDTQAGSTPSGLTVDVHVPQDLALNPKGLAEGVVRDTTVALPAGITLNPAAADGLQACPEALVGYLPGESTPPDNLRFTAKLPQPFEPGVNFCPDASKVGEVEVKTPLLPNPLKGAAYLAEQNTNPFGSLTALYFVAEDPISGSLIKIAGDVQPDPVTGQLVTTLKSTPQVPFEDFKLKFFGGDRAPLATPAVCGSYTTRASFVPWSTEPGEPPAEASSTFNITSGPNGSPCQSPLPFAPSIAVGTTNIQAGGFSPLATTMSREDGQQNLQGIQLHMPPGLSGLLSGVTLCGEPQADEGTCGPGSLVGETTVSVGLGGDPFSVKGGRVYLTGPYQGAPFGLSIVNPAKAGPYDLGKGACDCVVVRAKIEVDPHTAQLTITTDNTGPYRIPTILDGIPLQIKHVNVTINREHFTFNPTNCNPMSITANLLSTEGTAATLNVPFQVTNCAILKFAPKFQVTTSGKTSKQNGASLTAKISYPAPPGTQANIASVKVDLPKQLPSRLTTLQKACLAAVFDTNPASCPKASYIGHATVHTPLIPVPLTGPAIFVSHGNEAFPSLTIVLQGYGVTVDLVGATFIKKGITSTTFKTTPDVPFNTFELTLPQGKYSALAANGNLCKTKLNMPTAFTAQNGATIHQTTKITITNCPKTKTKTTNKHKQHKHG